MESHTHTRPSICWVKTRKATHQCVKHEDVIVVSLRVFHHDVEQGVQSVLQKLHQAKTTCPVRQPVCQLWMLFTSGTTFLFTLLTLTTSSPSIILSFSRFSLRSSGRVLHLSSPSKPTSEERRIPESRSSWTLSPTLVVYLIINVADAAQSPFALHHLQIDF